MSFLDDTRDEELEALEDYRKGLQPAPVLYRAEGVRLQADNDGAMSFVASEESEDRMGDVITAKGWELTDFQKNPVFLYLHDQTFPPLGTWPRVEIKGKQLLASPKWDEEDEFAKLIKGKYERGVMKGVSVGFRPLEFEERLLETPRDTPFGKQTTGLLFKRQMLLEISAVALPAHPKTLRRALGIRSRFWIPFQVDAAAQVGDIRKQLTAIRDEADLLLKGFNLPGRPATQIQTPNTQAPNDESDWDAVIAKIQEITVTE